ncbi:hypothetical protein [Streptomyces sp. NPDC046371]|uniref:hypothetical protein n=1 Tax=Streptomyces sp. NPDC046371 TaxID=3154916 RepID=UPI0033ED886A
MAPSTSAAQFRAQHGDPSTWSPADFDTYETEAELANPVFAEAAATDRYVLGRHDENGRVVVDLATAEELAEHRPTGPVPHLLLGGLSGAGKTPPAPLTGTAA